MNRNQPILRAGNIAETLITEQDLVWIPESRVSDEQRMLKDDIAICMSSGSGAVVGKTARLEKDWVGCVGAFCAIIRPQDNVNADFLAHYLSGPQFAYWRRTQAQGANIQNLRVSELERFKVPLPPISEQQRIVKILQEAEEIRRLQVIAETKSALLTSAIFDELFGDPIINSKKWNVQPLSNLIQGTPKNGLYKPSTAYGSGTPIIRIGDFYNGKLVNVANFQRLQISEKELSQFQVTNGEILVNRVNSIDFLGKSTLVAGLTEPTVVESNMMRFRMDDKKMLPAFLIQILQHPSLLRVLRAKAKQAVNQASINQDDLLTLNIPQPPIEVQQIFLNRIESFEDISQATISANIHNLKLSSSLLANAFTDQLTAQWREKHQDQLEEEAQQRDEAMQAAGAIITRPVRTETIEARYTRRSDGAYAELTREQHAVLEAIPRGEEAARWFTPEELAATIDGPLRGNRQAISSHLAVLAARGLVIAASLEQTAPDTGAVFYGNAYRLPLDDFEPAEGDTRETVVGDRARLREMARIVAQLEQGR